MSNKGKRYTKKFKKQIWVKDYNNSGSFKAKDNRTDKKNELIKLRKENQKLKMENDICPKG